MKRVIAGLGTAVVMGVLLWSGVRRPPLSVRAPEPSAPVEFESSWIATSPAEARVHELLALASRGDVAGYLAAFSGPLKARLEREVEERGRSGFADDLRKATQSRKSHAVFASEPDGPGAARVTVEAVYPDRNERQTYRVEQTAAGWLVVEVETVKSHQPQSKYGAPAVYAAPEGMPLQGGLTVETGEDAGGPKR
jgi:hypothetical protein